MWRYPHGFSVTGCAQHAYNGELLCTDAVPVPNLAQAALLTASAGRTVAGNEPDQAQTESGNRLSFPFLDTTLTQRMHSWCHLSPSRPLSPRRCFVAYSFRDFFQPDVAFGSGFVSLPDYRRTDSLVCFCLLLLDSPVLRMGRSQAPFFARMKTGQQAQGLPVLVHAPYGPELNRLVFIHF